MSRVRSPLYFIKGFSDNSRLTRMFCVIVEMYLYVFIAKRLLLFGIMFILYGIAAF